MLPHSPSSPMVITIHPNDRSRGYAPEFGMQGPNDLLVMPVPHGGSHLDLSAPFEDDGSESFLSCAVQINSHANPMNHFVPVLIMEELVDGSEDGYSPGSPAACCLTSPAPQVSRSASFDPEAWAECGAVTISSLIIGSVSWKSDRNLGTR
ncbi:unnamed protein product [Cyprideis torosa]|uniref:Uncharacterized protein n=1 Tax=Cyprideis torosa TaxID=163714 RepID=A0A7R8ZG78_9CRUS|nr:unnamed protein product [Cyprideis torosa]CAG0881003.1 unnamed protein product [Cyprideis torosa]